MKRITFATSILLLITLLALGATVFADGEEPTLAIQVSPHTLNLASHGGSFSIHADVNYNAVDEVVLAVDGAPLNTNHTGEVVEGEPTPDCTTFADDLGNLVVKCDLETVKGLVTAGEARFALSVDADGTTLNGAETIDVVDHGHNGNSDGGNGDCACDGSGEGNGTGECDGSGEGPHGHGQR